MLTFVPGSNLTCWGVFYPASNTGKDWKTGKWWVRNDLAMSWASTENIRLQLARALHSKDFMQTTLTSKTLKPFSGSSYGKNERKCGDDATPCVICGRAIKNGAEEFVAVVVDGGAAFGDDSSDQNARGYLGYFPVGSECAKKF